MRFDEGVVLYLVKSHVEFVCVCVCVYWLDYHSYLASVHIYTSERQTGQNLDLTFRKLMRKGKKIIA